MGWMMKACPFHPLTGKMRQEEETFRSRNLNYPWHPRRALPDWLHCQQRERLPVTGDLMHSKVWTAGMHLMRISEILKT